MNPPLDDMPKKTLHSRLVEALRPPVDAAPVGNYGLIAPCDYAVLLRLSAIATTWHIVDLLHRACSALGGEQRVELGRFLDKHLVDSVSRMREMAERFAGAATASHALCLDTATHHLAELVPIRQAFVEKELDIEWLWTWMQSRAGEAARTLSVGTRYASIEWCQPAITTIAPAFHLELAPGGVELRYSFPPST